jgi:hypothetical protein
VWPQDFVLLCQFERQNGVTEPGIRLTKLKCGTRFSNMDMSQGFNVGFLLSYVAVQ